MTEYITIWFNSLRWGGGGGGDGYGRFGHLYIFHLLHARNGALEVQLFQGFIFWTLSKTLIACRDM